MLYGMTLYKAIIHATPAAIIFRNWVLHENSPTLIHKNAGHLLMVLVSIHALYSACLSVHP